MRKTTLWLALILLALAPAFAQETTGKIHGHAQDPVSVAMKGSSVFLSTDTEGKNVKYTFKVDDNGDYKGEGIAPGTYFVTVTNADQKPVDQFPNVKIAAGQDVLQDFDLSRPDYMSKLSPEVRKQAEETRAKNAAALKENSQIKNLNAMLAQARADNKAKNYTEAETLMKQATAAKPDVSFLWLELGDAQLGQKKYDEAIESLKKAVDLETNAKKVTPEIVGEGNDRLGKAYAAAGKAPEATAAFDAAAKANPAGAARYYTNDAIVFRGKDVDAVAVAADKAIAADPTQALPYYLKGEALISKATVDPKTQKIVAPPGCAEAYQKYLELAPTGQFAADAKGVLDGIGSQVKSTYKSTGKK